LPPRRNTGHLSELFQQWTPDLAERERILVTNPAGLYGFLQTES
jgi:predicted TIM-barrel fold metal-dependent hydrolase